jgi:PadR family transcriptional regulator PadR
MVRGSQTPEAPLGSFEEMVMLAVAHTGAQAFGMSVRREIEERTGREVAIGAVYATLDRLEAKGLIVSDRNRDTGPGRRIFTVTRQGIQALAETREMREQLWAGIDLRRLGPGRA